MQTLNNGATAIQISGNTVLADFRGEFVTWKINDEGDCYWGHYFGNSLSKAIEDFENRA